MPSLLVLGDSLTFHGPQRPELLTDPRLYPNVAGRALGSDWNVDVLARMGWTARDAWWAITKDPYAWSVLVPRADALLLGVGQMDQLPAAVPTYLRDGIPYLRPGTVRRRVRAAYRSLAPRVIKATGGPFRQLPQAATDAYLSRIANGVRHYRPGIPVALLAPSPHTGPGYPSQRFHRSAVVAARRWAGREGVELVELDPIVQPSLDAGTGNPDGLHWGWDVHTAVGQAAAGALRVPSTRDDRAAPSPAALTQAPRRRGDPS